MRYAILEPQGGFDLVINVTLWDGRTTWSPPDGTTALPCPDKVGPGWTLKEFIWYPPEQIIPEVPLPPLPAPEA